MVKSKNSTQTKKRKKSVGRHLCQSRREGCQEIEEFHAKDDTEEICRSTSVLEGRGQEIEEFHAKEEIEEICRSASV